MQILLTETRMSHMMQILKNKSEEDKEKWLNHMISQDIRQKKNGTQLTEYVNGLPHTLDRMGY